MQHLFDLSSDLIKIDHTKNKQWATWLHHTTPTCFALRGIKHHFKNRNIFVDLSRDDLDVW